MIKSVFSIWIFLHLFTLSFTFLVMFIPFRSVANESTVKVFIWCINDLSFLACLLNKVDWKEWFYTRKICFFCNLYFFAELLIISPVWVNIQTDLKQKHWGFVVAWMEIFVFVAVFVPLAIHMKVLMSTCLLLKHQMAASPPPISHWAFLVKNKTKKNLPVKLPYSHYITCCIHSLSPTNHRHMCPHELLFTW